MSYYTRQTYYRDGVRYIVEDGKEVPALPDYVIKTTPAEKRAEKKESK